MEKNHFPTVDGFYALEMAARRRRAEAIGRMLVAAGRGLATLARRVLSNSKGELRHA